MYPTDKIYIVKIKNKTYLAFLENRDGTRIKFFDSGDVIPINEVYSYISKRYNRPPVWIRPVSGNEGSNKYCKDASRYSFNIRRGAYDSTPPAAFFSISSDLPSFNKQPPNRPSDYLGDYESDNNDLGYGRRYRRETKRRMDAALREYEQELAAYEDERDSFPSFMKNKYYSYTESDICDLMEWLRARDPEKEPETEKYYSVLDF